MGPEHGLSVPFGRVLIGLHGGGKVPAVDQPVGLNMPRLSRGEDTFRELFRFGLQRLLSARCHRCPGLLEGGFHRRELAFRVGLPAGL